MITHVHERFTDSTLDDNSLKWETSFIMTVAIANLGTSAVKTARQFYDACEHRRC